MICIKDYFKYRVGDIVSPTRISITCYKLDGGEVISLDDLAEHFE